ncbi:MAG: YkgJ family cysteine cluster protein [Desulfovibrio sp.]
MALDLTEYFEKYEAVAAEATAAFDKICEGVDFDVKCGKGCSDCCHAVFDLTLIEALYLNHKFNEQFKGDGAGKSAVLERADTADRQVYQLKRRAFKATQEGRTATEILQEMSKARIRCPLLDEKEGCEIYDARPITCRLYGVPTVIEGSAKTCHISGFEPGKAYPSIHMDVLMNKLHQLSREVAKHVRTRYAELADMLVPVSMALATDYDEHYLGCMSEEEVAKKEELRKKLVAESLEAGMQKGPESACSGCGDTDITIPGHVQGEEGDK